MAEITQCGGGVNGILWITEIVNLICNKGDTAWVQSVVSSEHLMWLETKNGFQCIKDQKDPRFYISHLPAHMFPRSLFKSKAKCVSIMRNPRDVVTSGFHFWKSVKITREPESFEEYLEGFPHRGVPYGSWFDHVCNWLQVKGKNFLVISYEELQQDIRASVEMLSHFLGKKLSAEELNLVLKNVSFKTMKDNKMHSYSLSPDVCIDHSKFFLRKGHERNGQRIPLLLWIH
ncbi:3-beta-hydroxysteroid sulfotransferase-like [Hippopotamus amphibius kiboko]|uniref:3-beta-hydroxysteroid sulfotransferase-like n=1 Tax=Hippopotamus amphibius kiboko TaxID=575201 RepID=UPI0025953016|nr:3-beta-hydroxysteroid sulfotransferase-like [Hippopotamus amphibius kiboko]